MGLFGKKKKKESDPVRQSAGEWTPDTRERQVALLERQYDATTEQLEDIMKQYAKETGNKALARKKRRSR